MSRRPDGQAALSCVGGNRFRVVEWLPEAPYPRATVQPLPTPPVTVEHRAAFGLLCARVVTLLEDFADDRGVAAIELNPVERLVIEDALKASGQRISAAAQALGLPRKTLFDRMRRLGLSATP